ncbi:hypothetical protein [Leptospira kmetyi]|uniref:hypothetical protein n=1 Tax=Leptospira kmetyi TaxID=408139 RepID=UPI00028A16A3|nr:hypothetical protein [Leptospira kmetyi]EQA55406.1 hypothetical protein LEP1GSC052_0052 [Leptospira kmetyi serovar Malaysia str. Bejo-Iso9]
MLAVFDFLLKGIGSKVRIGKGGPFIVGTASGVELKVPNDSDFARLKVGDPQEAKDAVNLTWVREHVLSNWNTPVQNLFELKNVPASERSDKQIREVEDELSFFQFDANSTAVFPDPNDPTRCILPNDLTSSSPGRWLKTTSRAQLHSQLLGLGVGDDHPQYQRRTEKNSSLGFPGLTGDQGNPGIEFISGGSIISSLRSLATNARNYFLPDKNGILALDDQFLGSSETNPGNKGLVPAPSVSDREKFLSGDGTWKTNFGSLKNSNIISNSYTATKYERVLVDTSSGLISILLPESPQDNTVIGILDLSNHAGTSPITLQRNGSKIEESLEDWQLDLDGGYWELAFSEARGSWFFLSVPFYNNVSPSASFLTDSPSFSEVSIAPSARAVKEYVDTKDLTLLQSIAQVGAAQIGTGQIPAGTLIKNAFFEGITNGSGQCSIDTGLGSNIVSALAFVSDASNAWYLMPPSGVTSITKYDNQGIVTVQFTGSSVFQNRNVRFRVEYK